MAQDEQIDADAQRKMIEELIRKQQAQVSGFVASERTREEQKKRRAQQDAEREQARQQALQSGQGLPFQPNDMFLKALAEIYGLPPAPQSFEQSFVPILMASKVINMQAGQVLVGQFAGAQELPPIQIAKDHVITQGGRMTPELAMQLAMLAASNPDMRRDGVEIKGATEEDKMMLLAAADLLKLKVLNRDEVKIDNEQAQAQRMQACQQGWQNLQQWSVPGSAPAPAPAQGSQSGPGPDDDSQPRPVVSPQRNPNNNPSNAAEAAAAAAGAIPPAAAAATSTPLKTGQEDIAEEPGAGDPQNPGGQKQVEKLADYKDLEEKHKAALRDYLRAGAPSMTFTDEEADAKLEPYWNKLTPEQQRIILMQAVMNRPKKQQGAEAAPAAITADDLQPPDAPTPPPAPVLKPVGQRKFDELVPAERHALRDWAKKNQKPANSVEKSWNRLGKESREKRMAEAVKLDKTAEDRIKKQLDEKQRDMNKQHEAAIEKQEEDHKAEVALFKAAMAAADPASLPDAPALKPVAERKFSELLPAEKELLKAYAKSQKDDPAKLASKWGHMKPGARQKYFNDAAHAKKNLGFDAIEQQKAAVQALADAAARAKAKVQVRENTASTPAEPIRTWAELDEEERKMLRDDISRAFKRHDGNAMSEEDFGKIWDDSSKQRGASWQAETMERVRKQGEMLKAMATPPSSADDRLEQIRQASAAVVPPSATDRLQQEQEAGAPLPSPAANADVNQTGPEIVPAPVVAGPVADTPAAPQKHWFTRAREWFMNNIWTPLVSRFKSTPTPAPMVQAEPEIGDLPLNIEASPDRVEPKITPVAPGVDAAAKKDFKDLLLQEKRMLLVDHLKRNGASLTDGPETEWNALDEAGRAALFNQAFENQPQLRDRVVAEQDAKKAAAPALNQEPPQPAPAVIVVEEVAAAAPTLKPARERNWSELLDAEKEALAVYFEDKDGSGEWDGMNGPDRETAIEIGLEAKPELRARIEDAIKAENVRLAAAANPASATPPDTAVDRVVQAQTTPPPSSDARNAQNDAAAKPVVEAQEIPKDDPAFEAALAAEGFTHAELMGKTADERNDIIARIKQNIAAKESAPVVPSVAKGDVTKTFNVSVDTIRDLPLSTDARKVIDRSNLPKAIDRDKFAEVYQQIRAEVVQATPGSRITHAFLNNAAYKNHTQDLLGHRGLTSPEAHVILDALRAEGLTTGKKDTHRNPSFAVDDWQSKLASRYEPPAGPQPT